MIARSPSSVLVQGLRDVVEAFEDELARAPRVVELLAILRWGARTLPDGALADAHPDEIEGFDTLPPAIMPPGFRVCSPRNVGGRGTRLAKHLWRPSARR